MENIVIFAIVTLVGTVAFIAGCIVGSKLEASQEHRKIKRTYKLHKVEHIGSSLVPYDHRRKSFSDKIIEHLTTEALIDYDNVGGDLSVWTFKFLTKKK